MHAFCDVLDAVQFPNRVGIRRRQRRGRAEARLEIAQSLTGGGMIVLLHRVVFGVKRSPNHPVPGTRGSVVAEPPES